MNDLYRAYQNVLFSINVLGEDISKITYVVNGKRITAEQLTSMFKG